MYNQINRHTDNPDRQRSDTLTRDTYNQINRQPRQTNSQQSTPIETQTGPTDTYQVLK